MSLWTERLTPETLARRCERLVADGHLDGERAVMVHDLDRMEARVQALRDAFPSNALHGIAVKANPLVSVLEALVAAGAGLECASIEEVELCLAAGCPPEKIIFDSPAKTRDEIAFALEKGLHLNLDNFDELQRVATLAPSGPRGHVGIRVNPQVGRGSISMTSVAGRLSKFGVPLKTRRRALIEAFERYSWLDGLHVHVGSQGCTLDQLIDAAKVVWAFRVEAMTRRTAPITQLDIGGGLPVAYTHADRPPELSTYVARLREAIPGAFEKDVRLLTEFGRSVHAGCGWSISRVEYVKREEGQTMAVIHLGADALMRRVYRPDDWDHELMVLDPRGGLKPPGASAPVTVVGPLCFGGDIIARDRMLPPVEEGDLIIIRDTGAYTLSMWSRHCSRGLPKVIGWRDDARSLLKRRETPADVVSFWSR